ncbi:diacylglycerol kinase [Parageobacillus thermoglucosidasius]|uniref:Diacylglycerol kinase n=3 Tax=Anoxybacillaceae TaxID=3120669 RepID=A0AB38R1X8_PARTM|nr:diacylglycerol kinase [Parageobacillus thermoglucosidasius]ALF09476.1 lipid kinase [Parageobacillus thermoglucosidasius]ANZ29559.1 diacylglycerol kinase [Parageobacillus thermoglucosidasius]APM80297.1 diacylglycerol kinase [Parageobacillus thermoglucosidasius]KJX70162.1 lipid kinase [Parageobacillus thermoglucosidasius]RDE20872.1 diacylglycerol kinase [Parageobacillus thermoglucosidasius]
MKRARIIYNPTSGREIFKRHLPDVLERLEKAGYETSCHATTGAGDATEAARKAVEREFDLVVAAGGDGTINEVVNGIADQDYRPKLAIIPVGTTNDFARAIGVPRSIEGACDVITRGEAVPIDIGSVTNEGKTRYFINIAGGGRLTELTYEVPSKLKTVLGQLAYYLKGMEMLPSIKATEARIEYDGKLFEGEIMLFLVSLTNSVGGFEKLAPDSSLNDGMFDLIILKKTNLAEFIRLVTLAARGEHINDPHLIYTKANRIKVTSPNNMQLNLDGEFGGMLPGEFVNLYQHLEVFVPKEKAEQIRAGE